jgi:hypothetical protein
MVPFLCRPATLPGSAKSWQVALAAVLVVSTAAARPAEACSCFENPPCAAVWKADAVFIGTVVEEVPERIGGSLSWTVHKVAVGQVLRGSIDSFVTLVPGNRPTAEQVEASKSHSGESMLMSTCDYGFEVGKRYVVYAHRTADGRWTTSMCSGTKPLEDASADLDYIATIPTAEPTGRVYGIVERMVPDPADPSGSRSVPVADVQIALVSRTNRLTTTTDKEGRLDVQVPPGEYTIAPVLPETVRVSGAPYQTSVPARGCAPVRFSLSERTN